MSYIRSNKEGKARLLIFTDCYIYGGSERLMTFLLSNEQVRKEYDLIFAYRSFQEYKEGLKKDLDKLDVAVEQHPLFLLANVRLFYRINCTKLPSLLKVLLKIPFYVFEQLGFYFVFNILVMLFFIRRIKPDIVHINNGGYPGANSCNQFVISCVLLNVKSIVYQINNMASAPKHIFARMYDKFIMKQVRYFTTASLGARNALVNIRKFDPAQIVQIPNTVSVERITMGRNEILKEMNWGPDVFLLVQVAFLTARKGQIYLLQAINEILKEKKAGISDKLKLILVGNGEDEQQLKKYVFENNLEESVFFAGYRSDSADFINACEFFLLPSISNEDMPLALLTAMSQGKLIISTKFAGILEAITNGENGVLIDRDPSQLVEQLKTVIGELYEKPALCKLYGERAKITFEERYSTEAYGRKLTSLYKASLN
jgi:glycosyltransferase involved in cell wall biosynthesis